MQMVFDAGDLTSGEKSVLLAYCNFTDPHGYCWPGVERIADMTGFSDRGVKKIRKALIERGLLATSSRVNAQGVRTTNITRVNLERLAAMRMPEKTYKDNVVHELEFNDTTPEQPKCTEGTPAEQPKGTEFPDPVNTVPRKDGAHSSPYPSGDPSLEPSSSSAEVEDITNVVVPPQTKKKTESPEAIIERRLGCTTDEAAKVATLINQQGDGKGGRIRSLAWWVENRDLHTLRQDLAIVRGPQGPAGVAYSTDPGAYLRNINKGGHTPYKNPENQDVYDEPLLPIPEKTHKGSRGYVPPNEYWDNISDEDLKNSFL
jgi:hypothetical protein